MNIRSISFRVMLAAGVVWTQSASATIHVTADLDNFSTFEPVPRLIQIFGDDTSTRLTASVAGNLRYISTFAGAFASYGTLRALAVSDAQNPGGELYGTRRASARAVLEDDITIAIPGVAVGTLATATLDFDLHAQFGVQDGGLSDISRYSAGGRLHLRTTANGAINQTLYDSLYNAQQNLNQEYLKVWHDAPISAPPTARGGRGYLFAETLSTPFSFAVGQPFAVQILLEATASASAFEVGDRVSMTVNAFNTASWGGFSQVTLDDGTVVTDFTARGAAFDTDYRFAIAPVPVPVPMSLWLFSPPLLLAWLKRPRAVGARRS